MVKKKGSFIAFRQITIGMLCMVILFLSIALAMILGIIIVPIEGGQIIPYVIGIVVAIVGASSILIVTLFCFWHKVQILDDVIILKGIHGEISRYKVNEIQELRYCKPQTLGEFPRYPFLMLRSKAKMINGRKIGVNSKGGPIGFDLSKKRLAILREFWKGEIKDLPAKYSLSPSNH